EQAIDDATAEELLAGRYEGDAPDLVAVSQILEQVRSVAREPPPLPSPTLAAILRGSPPVTVFQPASAGSRRPKAVGVPAVSAAVSAAVAALILLAGSARVLPGPTQDIVARIVRTVTPFDIPARTEPDAVMARAPRAGAALSPDDPIGAGIELPPLRGGLGTNGDPIRADDATGSRPPAGSLAPGPAPSTTVAPRPAPAVPGTAPPTVPRPDPRLPGPSGGTVPPSPVKPGELSADLIAATDSQRTGTPVGHGTAAIDANRGKDELCLTLVLSGTAPVSSVHLHAGRGGVNDPVVATFTTPTAGTSVCVTVADRLVKKIRKEPGGYYVEVHTTDPLNGALRGQLTK
ncbi:MAG: CHRD domain-containing protein, partial [Actinobacteria bacterium]|nr:CHRD domain-containing protein [Actinomycetota bacterium]